MRTRVSPSLSPATSRRLPLAGGAGRLREEDVEEWSCLVPYTIASNHRTLSSSASLGSMGLGGTLGTSSTITFCAAAEIVVVDLEDDVRDVGLVLGVSSKSSSAFASAAKGEVVDRPAYIADTPVGGGDEGGVELEWVDDERCRMRWRSPRNALPMFAICK